MEICFFPFQLIPDISRKVGQLFFLAAAAWQFWLRWQFLPPNTEMRWKRPRARANSCMPDVITTVLCSEMLSLNQEYWNLLSVRKYDIVERFKNTWTFPGTNLQSESASQGNTRKLVEATWRWISQSKSSLQPSYHSRLHKLFPFPSSFSFSFSLFQPPFTFLDMLDGSSSLPCLLLPLKTKNKHLLFQIHAY